MRVRPLQLLRGLWWAVVPIGLTGLVYTLLLAGALGPPNGFWSTDQGTKLIQTQSLLLTKYRTNALVYPGAPFDPDGVVSPLRGTYITYQGQTFSIWSALFAFLSSVPFFLLGYPGLYVLPIGATLATLACCAALGLPLLGRFWTCCALLVCGLASPLFFYSMIFWEHTPVALLVVAAIWLLLRGYERQRLWLAVLGGCALGAAVWLRSEALLCAPALSLAFYAAVGRRGLRAIWCFGGAVALLTSGSLLFNRLVYGSWVGPHIQVATRAHGGGDLSLASLLVRRRDWAELLLAPSTPPAFGLLVAAVVLLALLAHLRRWPRVRQAGQVGLLALLPLVAVGSVVVLGSGVQTNPQLNGGEQTALALVFPLALLGLLPAPPRVHENE